MTPDEAKAVLWLHRPGRAEPSDPDPTAALALARQDAALGQWLAAQQRFHARVGDCLRSLEPPAELKERILARQPVREPRSWWRQPALWAAVGFGMLLLGGGLRWAKPRSHDDFASFRVRMARFAVRQYGMDLATNDLDQIRAFLAQAGRPSTFVLTTPLAKLPLLGCAALTWHGQPVSMLCFDRGRGELVWLFVVRQPAVRGAPLTAAPRTARVGALATASWTVAQKTYLVAVAGDPALLRRFL